MKRKGTGKGIMAIGSLRTDGITTYMKQGRLIIRSANSMEKRSNTLPQFIQRQKMRHSVALWKLLKYCEPMFTKGPTAYNNFLSLANQLPVVYVEKVLMERTSFLMPGIPVSDGTLPEVKQLLGEVDGVPALITDLKAHDWEPWTKLWLYTAVQTGSDRDALVRFSKREVPWEEVTLVDGHYVLAGEEFADDIRHPLYAVQAVHHGGCLGDRSRQLWRPDRPLYAITLEADRTNINVGFRLVLQ